MCPRPRGRGFGFRRKPIVVACGTSWRNKQSRLGSSWLVKSGLPVELPPWLLKLAARPCLMGSPPIEKTNRNGRGCGLGRQRGGLAAGRNGDSHWPASEFRGHRRQPIILPERPAVFDGHVLTIDEAGFLQASSECLHQMRSILGRPGAEIPDHRHGRLLRARRERPRRREAEQGDELASS